MITTVMALALALVLAASHAEAACAWVLWNLPDIGEAPDGPPIATYETRRACLDDAVALARTAQQKRPGGQLGSGVIVSYTYPDGTKLVWTCFSDTIDPRGPKGGSR